MKVIVGGILGGAVLFLWGGLSHEVLPLGVVGLRSMPAAQEGAVVAGMRGAMNERALYFFPGMDITRKLTADEEQAWKAKYEAGPAGLVVFNPHPGSVLGARQLLTELGADILAALVAGFLLLQVPASLGYLPRALLTMMLGLLMWIDIDISYWNWYGFPTSYMLAQLLDHTVGWFLAGLVLARFCRR